MRVCLVGNVDAGKTAIYEILTRKSVRENYNRTEELRLFKLDNGIELLDSPGHELLNSIKEDVIRMSDLILYVVDARRPDLRLLPYLLQRPIILLINKWDLVSPGLRPSLGQEFKLNGSELSLRLSNYRDKAIEVGHDGVCFTDLKDNDDLKKVIIPTSAKKIWGFDVLVKILNKLVPLVPPSKKFLYRIGEESFLRIGNFSDRLPYERGLPVLGVNPQTIDLDCDADIRMICLQDNAPDAISINGRAAIEIPETLKQVLVYTEDPGLWASCKRLIYHRRGIIRLSKKSSKLPLPKESLRILITKKGPSKALTSKNNIEITGTSLIALTIDLESQIARYNELRVRALKEEYGSVYLLETNPKFVFYNTKKQGIIGVRLLDGELRVGSRIAFLSGKKLVGRGTVKRIEDKGKSITTLDYHNVYVALNLNMEDPIDFKMVALRGISEKIRDSSVPLCKLNATLSEDTCLVYQDGRGKR